MKFPLFRLAEASPLPVAVTCAVDDVVDVVAYCTPIVQVAPGARTVVPVHWVPEAGATMVNVPGPADFVTVGAAVNVNALAVTPDAVFLTVIVPVLVVVLGAPTLHPPVPPVLVHSGGTGAENVSVAPVTWNAALKVALRPPLLVTVTFLAVSPAPLAITQDAVTVVGVFVPVGVQVMLPPLIVTVVALLRFVPVSVTATVVPRTPDVGKIEVSVGGTQPAPAPGAPRNSTAPGSKQPSPVVSALGLPKKSRGGCGCADGMLSMAAVSA